MLEVMGKVWAILGLPGRHWFILGGRDLGLRAVLGGGGQCWDAGRDVKGGHWWLLGRGNLWHMHVAERLNEAVRRHLGGGGRLVLLDLPAPLPPSPLTAVSCGGGGGNGKKKIKRGGTTHPGKNGAKMGKLGRNGKIGEMAGKWGNWGEA